MIHLFINALAASAGGGRTYVRNIIPQLATQTGVRVTIALSPDLRRELDPGSNVDFVELDMSPTRRFWYEQYTLPELIRKSRANILLSAGNFALRKSPLPQILLSRNSLYLSLDFFDDLRSRGEYRMWLETRARAAIAKRSIHWADVTVAPSQAFAHDLQRWTGANIIAIHHGFDRKVFTQDSRALSPEVRAKLDAVDGSLKILFVSHYNYYRNFETLFRALPILRDQLPGRTVRLLLTCHLLSGTNPGSYRVDGAAQLVKTLGVSDMIVELGAISYPTLHKLYTEADVYVTPAYTETFAHPLVEAMASGIPIVASDIAVHREICGRAATYFERFSPEVLATCVLKIAQRDEVRKALVERGRSRADDFSWKIHVEKILELSRELANLEVSAKKR